MLPSARFDLLVCNAWMGFVVVLVILALFLKARFAEWVSLGIPVSFPGTSARMPLFGLSLNLVTLFALAVTLGPVVVVSALLFSWLESFLVLPAHLGRGSVRGHPLPFPDSLKRRGAPDRHGKPRGDESRLSEIQRTSDRTSGSRDDLANNSSACLSTGLLVHRKIGPEPRRRPATDLDGFPQSVATTSAPRDVRELTKTKKTYNHKWSSRHDHGGGVQTSIRPVLHFCQLII